MPSFGGVLLSYFCTVGGKNSSNHSNIHNAFTRVLFFLTALWFSWTEVFVILNYQMVPLKKIELRCLEDVLFSVMSMGKVSYKIQPQIWGLLACGELFFFFVHSHEETNTCNTTVYSTTKAKIVIFLIIFT